MRCTLALLLLLFVTPVAIAEPLSPLTKAPMDEKWINPWPEDWEAAFRERAQVAIEHYTAKPPKNPNTYFENEKGSYPPLMFHVLYGQRAGAVKGLQAEDNQAGSWNSQTKGIDYYACFTLKHQMRKYFLLGEHLDPAYKQRMFDGAKLWTEKDPMRRPSKYYKGGEGWTPVQRNSWVDVRNTDNLRAMRETSVYLMAEEVGNEKLRLEYKADIQRYVWALWHIGMGEWDSENYHFHTIAPYINLYDFAKDPEVKATAKAALDMLFTMAAVKYINGGWCGPIKRDYNKPYVFGGAAGEGWLYFGDTPVNNPKPHGDKIHMISSVYRPPAAVVALAQKQFEEGVELFAAKPQYETWNAEGGGSAGADYPAPNYQQAGHRPWVTETTYIGQTFQLGTLPRGSFGDVNGFKLLMRDSQLGAQFFIGASVDSPTKVNRGSGRDRIAHYRNAMINLTANGSATWSFLIPLGATIEDVNGVRFILQENTWLALHPINLDFGTPDGKSPKKWKHSQGMPAKGTGGGVSGFVLEAGEPRTHENVEKFKAAVLKQAAVKSDGRRVDYTTTTGQALALDLAAGATVFRDGKPFNSHAQEHWALYRPADGSKAPISLGWKEGKLRVSAGGFTFEATYPDNHHYTWKHGGK